MLRNRFLLNIAQNAFSIEDKHTTKVLRQQKHYGATKMSRMFLNKNWTLSGVKIVLSKMDATGSVECCSGSCRPRTARSPDTIKQYGHRTPSTMRCGGSYNSVCTNTTGSRTWKSCASVLRRNGTAWTRKRLTTRSVNGASDLTACIAAGRGHFKHSL